MPDEITNWLEEIGLGEHAAAFVENSVDHGLLPHLTNEDLKDLGITKLGDRKRLLLAIEQLSLNAGLAGNGGAEQNTIEGRGLEAERRQLTVMFVDLVGSTALSSRLDPEDLRALMRRYQAAVAGVIEISGGYLANWLGDGAIAYFGWPTAREDQATESVRAGLAVVDAVSAVPVDDGSGEHLAARVGIATGQVVVGDLEQGSIGQHDMVTGETPNLAARLESVAPPGGVAIGGTTRALVHAAFDLEFLGPQNLKGFSAPVDTWLVRAEREVESLFEEPGARLTAFTGRTHEVGLLLDRWRQVQDGDGQVVLISGEPGIGKSRIVQAVRERIDGDRHRRIFYQCSPHHVNTALHPAIRQFEHAAGIAAGDAAAVKLDRIEAVLRQASADIAQIAPLIAALLSIPFEDRYGALDMPPQQQGTATLRALSDQLLELARNEPVLFVLEDAHWIDPTTQELIVETVPRLTNRRVLMLITHRPEWRDPFHGLSHVTTLNMTRLSRTQIGEMVHDVAGRDLPEATATRIVERTDGVPLFIEELTKAMAEAGFDLADEDVPATLQASLLSRLDRLGSAKEIAQIGAVIGRDFSRDMLARITEERVDLDAGLERLIDSQLIFRTRHREGDGYTFKHALVQDIAYDSLLRQRRQRLHLAIAQVFAAGDGPEAALEVLARHFERGSDLVRAMDVWEKAGDAAAARPAQPEAAANYGKALHLRGNNASVSPDDPGTLSLLLRLGQAQFGALGGGDPLTLSTFQRARTLAKRLGDPVDTCIALYGAWVSLIIAARMDETIAVAKELTQLAGPDSEPWMRATAYRAMGSTQFLMGRLPESEDTYKQCLATIDSGLDEYPAALPRPRPRSDCTSGLGKCRMDAWQARASAQEV